MRRAAEYTAVALLLCVPILGSVSHARFTLDPSHTGYFLKLALDVVDGKVLFRDAFDPYGALTVWIQAVGLLLFKNVQMLIWITGLMLAATGVLLYSIWRRLLSPSGSLLALLIFVTHTRWPTIPWPNFYGTFFSTAAAWFLVRDLEAPAGWRMVAAGVMVALAFLSRHEIGACTAVALTLYLLVGRRPQRTVALAAARPGRDVMLVYSGCLAVLAVFFSWLWAVGALEDWYLQGVRMVRVYFEPLIGVQTAFRSRVVQFLAIVFDKYRFWLAFTAGSAAVLFVIAITRGFENRRLRIAFLLSLTASVGALQSYPIPNEFRYAIGLSPAYGLLVFALLRAAAPLGRLAIIVAVAVVLIVNRIELLALTRDVGTHWWAAQSNYPGYERLSRPAILDGVWLPHSQARFYSEINTTISSYLNGHPGTPVLTTTGDPLPLTFVDHNPNFHTMFVVYPSIRFADMRGMFGRPEGRRLPPHFDHYERFVDDTANVILYHDFWQVYVRFVNERKPLIVNHGNPIPVTGYTPLLDITYVDDGMIDWRFNYWWDQFAATPRVVIWGYEAGKIHP